MERSFIFAAVIVTLAATTAFIAAQVARGVVVVGVKPFTFVAIVIVVIIIVVVVVIIITVIVLVTIEPPVDFITLVFSALLFPALHTLEHSLQLLPVRVGSFAGTPP